MSAYLYTVFAIVAALYNIAKCEIDVSRLDNMLQLKQLDEKIAEFRSQNNEWIKRLVILESVIVEAKIAKEEGERIFLTHSHIMTPFDAPGKQAFRKHCGKRRNCS